MECGIVKRQMVVRSPKIQNVALDRTGSVETLEEVFAKMHREGGMTSRRLAMHRTGSASLLAPATQAVEQTQVTQHLFHGDLFTQNPGLWSSTPSE
jgi:hypothetical protein